MAVTQTAASETIRALLQETDRIVKEAAANQKETDRQMKERMEETDRQIKETDRKLKERMEETDRQLKESKKETDRQMKERMEETDRQLKETDRKFKERIEENDRQMKETDRQMKETDRQIKERIEENDRKLKERMEENDRQMKETDRQIKKAEYQTKPHNKQFGNNRFGEVSEYMIAPNLCEKFRDFNLIFQISNSGTRVSDHENKIFFEVDVMLENSDKAMLVEVKTKLTIEDVKGHISHLKKMRKYADLHGDKRSFLGAAAGAVMTSNVKEYALEQGLYVIEPSGETFNITPPRGKPKEW